MNRGGRVPMHRLRAGDLSLEPLMASHAEAMFEVLSDPAIYEYENEPPPSVHALRERYARLESRLSPDGQEIWLNWVVRLGTGEAIGFVQATLRPDGQAAVAYELASDYWGRGLASQAVRAMLLELVERYQARDLWAVLKRVNHRSQRLLQRAGFTLASPAEHSRRQIDADEMLMHLPVPAG
ncbi:MAG: GNAT family N-acetyltransferase [Ideonella sp.]|nr:GNAT family N-acetyltransferase [Ideonella sp.]